jgi:hypothetical protein
MVTLREECDFIYRVFLNCANNETKLLTENETMLFDKYVLFKLMAVKKYVILQNDDYSRKNNLLAVSSQNKVRYQNATSVLNSASKEIHFQKNISDVAYSSLRRLTVFCSHKQREVRALHRRMLTENRKCFLEAQNYQPD